MIIMAKAGDIYAKALCQVMERSLIAEGIEPALAKILSGKACQEGVKATGRGAKRAAKGAKKQASKGLNAWQRFIKNNKNKYKYKSGKRKGQVNMKAASAAFKKTPAGRRKKK